MMVMLVMSVQGDWISKKIDQHFLEIESPPTFFGVIQERFKVAVCF